MVKVSVIVPVYNVEMYVTKCLDSLVKQTLDDIEIVVINDGSTDGCFAILEKYAKTYPQMRVINQTNQGLGAARNRGVKEARGKYLAFVDGDDFVETQMFESMYIKGEKSSADIVTCRYAQIALDGKIVYELPSLKTMDRTILLERCLLFEYPMMACNKLYRSDLFQNYSICFPEGVYYEDIPVFCNLLMNPIHIVDVDRIFYFWVVRNDSISRKIGAKNIIDRETVLMLVKKKLLEYGLYARYEISFMAGSLRQFTRLLHMRDDHELDALILSKISNLVDIQAVQHLYPVIYQDYDSVMRNKGFKMEELSEYETSRRIQISNENYDFSKKINRFFSHLGMLKKDNLKIALYGNGLVGTMAAQVLKDNVVVIVDQDQNAYSEFAKTCTPNELKEYDFDKLVICVLGREAEIEKSLTDYYGIEGKKIVIFDLTQEYHLCSPISLGEKERLGLLKDKFKGERCFIVGNGPSLNKCNLKLLENEYTFGVNGIFYKTDEMGFRPTFYMVEDRHVVVDNLERINGYECQYKFFPSIYANKIEKTENVYFFTADLGFYSEGHPFYCKPRFSKEFHNQAYTGQSVTYMQLQLAFFMGFSDVYLIGMDYNYDLPASTVVQGDTYISNEEDPNHFHPEYFGAGKKWHDPKIERVGWNYQKAKEVYEEEGRHIYNATIGGKLEIFERADYNGLFSDSHNKRK